MRALTGERKGIRGDRGHIEFNSVTNSLILWYHGVFETESVKNWLLSPVERKVRQRDFRKGKRGGGRKKD